MFPPMSIQDRHLKMTLIIVLIAGILSLHYLTAYHWVFRHAVYRMLFYLPLVLGSFWFGFKGAISVSISVIIFYGLLLISTKQNLSSDFHTLLEGGLYIFVALVLGYLSEKEKREQAARMEAERLAGIGRAVTEIAHDMKSPLMAIGGFTHQVSRKLPPEDPDRKKLDLVFSETSRLESMVKEMLDFGRPLTLQKKPESLNTLSEECTELVLDMAKDRGVEMKTKLDPELPLQTLDRDRMKQVILNLATNAIQASLPGSEVWIKTRKEGQEAVLDVTDHGSGIDEKDREKIFEPFYTTKKGGTGLGLAIVKKIIVVHGGNIRVHVKGEGGVTFSIRLPLESY